MKEANDNTSAEARLGDIIIAGGERLLVVTSHQLVTVQSDIITGFSEILVPRVFG